MSSANKVIGVLIVAGAGAGIYWIKKNDLSRSGQAQFIPASLTPEPEPSPSNRLSGLFNLFTGFLGGGSDGASAPADLATSLAPEATPAPVPTVTRSGGNVQGLLDLIGRAESRGDYNAVWSGSRVQPPRPITTMTVAQVLDWQRRSVAAGSYSSAAGKYQIIRKTLQSLVDQRVLLRDQLFTPDAQDRAGRALLERRGLSSYLSGRITREAFGNNLAREWAGLPVLTGSKAGFSFYGSDGVNQATVTVAAVQRALQGVA